MHARQDHARWRRERRGHPIFEQDEGARHGRRVLDVELYRDPVARLDPRVGQVPAHREPLARAHPQQRAGHRQRDHADRDHVHRR